MNHQSTIRLTTASPESIDLAFKTYYKQLLLFAYSFLENKQDAEDCVQESFTALLSKAHRWSHITDLRAYLYTIVQNKCLVALRDKSRKDKKVAAYQADHLHKLEQGCEPEILRYLLQREETRFVNRLLSLITSKRRKALQLVYLEGFEYETSASKMGVSLNTFKTTLRLAKRDIVTKLPTLLSLLLMTIL